MSQLFTEETSLFFLLFLLEALLHSAQMSRFIFKKA